MSPGQHDARWVALVSPGLDHPEHPPAAAQLLLLAPIWRQPGTLNSVPSIQVKDVPPETHDVLRRRAATAGQSLQEYLRGLMIRTAATPTVEEVLDRVQKRSGGSVPAADVVATLRSDRDRR